MVLVPIVISQTHSVQKALAEMFCKKCWTKSRRILIVIVCRNVQPIFWVGHAISTHQNIMDPYCAQSSQGNVLQKMMDKRPKKYCNALCIGMCNQHFLQSGGNMLVSPMRTSYIHIVQKAPAKMFCKNAGQNLAEIWQFTVCKNVRQTFPEISVQHPTNAHDMQMDSYCAKIFKENVLQKCWIKPGRNMAIHHVQESATNIFPKLRWNMPSMTITH
jgi:hypothetical protein